MRFEGNEVYEVMRFIGFIKVGHRHDKRHQDS